MAPLGEIHITDNVVADKLVKDLSEAEFDLLTKAQARKKQAVVANATTDVASNLSTSAETEKVAREVALNSCTMHGIGTAQACYENASLEDQAKLRKITKYEKDSMILLSPEGNELFRSHGMLRPTSLIGTDSFTTESYDNGAGAQKNIEAQWRHWFDASSGAPKGTYNLRADVMQSSGKGDNITAGSIAQWDSIYNLFAGIANNRSQENAGMQIARQMMGISGWIWTNEKTSSEVARRYGLYPDTCRRDYSYVDGSSLSVVGLENLQQAA